jgi:hypothetical protein
MNANEMPVMTSASYGNTTVMNWQNDAWPTGTGMTQSSPAQAIIATAFAQDNMESQAEALRQLRRRVSERRPNERQDIYELKPKHENQIEPIMATRRLIKVIIADPDEQVPLDKAVLYRGDEKFTDATDQELYFEVPIKELLDKHNALRAATQDKEASKKFGKEIFLAPIKIRDLRMVVINIATF